jgi:hypothetical protein
VRARARLHPYQARFEFAKKLQHLFSAQLPLQYHPLVTIHPMYLKLLLCQINPNSFNLHLGLLVRRVKPARCCE